MIGFHFPPIILIALVTGQLSGLDINFAEEFVVTI
jgi:hypothetical protein